MSGGLEVDIEAQLGGFRLAASFRAPAGVTALFGASGAGKSSVLAAVAGARSPDKGRILLGDEPLFDAERRIDTPMDRRGVGWVFQDARLFPHMSVAENLRYGARRARGRPVSAAFEDVVGVLGVAHLLGRRPLDLSGGERQRVGIGRALLSQPRLLLMDEPLASLDAGRKAEILPYLERLKEAFAVPVLYVTHSFAEVARLADRLVVLEAGRVVAEGPLAEVLARPDLPLLSGRADAAAALDAVVQSHDGARGLTRLDAGGPSLLTPALDRPPGARVRALVLARDVMVATTRPEGLSARNILPAEVRRIDARPDGTVLLSLGLGGGEARLLAAVTADAVAELGLVPGLPVWAVVKSVAVEGGRGGLLDALDD